MSVCCECCVLSGEGHECLSVVSVVCCRVRSQHWADQSSTESYRVWCGVFDCEFEASKIRNPWPSGPDSRKVTTSMPAFVLMGYELQVSVSRSPGRETS